MEIPELTAEQEAELQQLCDEVNAHGRALAEASQWEPRCIAAAFAPSRATFVFTMRAWIALDAVRSPVLLGRAPETAEALERALDAFGLEASEALTPEEAAVLATDMCVAVAAGFSTVLPMRPSEGGEPTASDGFGRWLPIFACLVVQCGLSPADAYALPVAQAYALLAAMRRNQGWREAGSPYYERDLEEIERAAAASEEVTSEPTEEGVGHA